MHPYRLAVCEDDQAVREGISQFCGEVLTEEKIPHEVTEFSSAEQLEKVLETKQQTFDLLILDIKLENKTGMELALELRAREERISILFITGYEEYWKQGYKVQPVQFLLKPLDWDELKAAVLTDWRQNHRPRNVLLEKGRRKVGLPLESILYVEPDKRHGVHIVLTDGELEFSIGLTELEKLLPEDQFVRCHKSYIINLKHIREINWLTVAMDNGCSVPVSRTYYQDCQDAFIDYINR